MKLNKGFLLVTAYLVIIVLLILGSAFLLRAVNEKNLVQRQIMSKQAFYLAEAGLQDAHKGLRENWSGYTTELPRSSAFSQSLGNGSFTVDIENDLPPDIIKLISKGTVGTVERTLEEKIKGMTGGDLSGFDFAVLAAGNLYLEGSGSIQNQDVYVNGNLDVHSADAVNRGDVYATGNVKLETNGTDVGSITGNVNANGNITVNSGSTITGDATSAKTVNNDGTITGTITSGADPNPVDETALATKADSYKLSSQDWDNYKAQAQVAGNYHAGTFFPSGSYTGIHYVDGNVTVDADFSGTATFVIDGNVKFESGNVNLDPASGNDYSFIIKGNVESTAEASGTLGGVIYSGGNFHVSSSVTLEGAVICFGNLYASGDFNIEFPVAGTTLKILSWREL